MERDKLEEREGVVQLRKKSRIELRVPKKLVFMQGKLCVQKLCKTCRDACSYTSDGALNTVTPISMEKVAGCA